ncbi:MAG: hypothetical protein GY898_02460 [Proteobacteria bacterium]|nr:hypothetical protein [Pseudomonadota bacterium]
MKLTRIALYVAVFLGVATACLVARPPDTPQAIKRIEGRFQWWWTSARHEDPLYRAPLPVDYTGKVPWTIADGGEITVVFGLDPDIERTVSFRAPLAGALSLDSRNWDSVTGEFQFDLTKLESDDGKGDRAAKPILRGLDASKRDGRVTVSGALIGTMARTIGAEAKGWLLLSTSATDESRRAEVVTTRLAEDRIRVESMDPIGWSSDGFPEIERLASVWGTGQRLPGAAIELDFVLVRGSR